MTFTVNDMFPVHFSNQQDELVNHIFVPFRIKRSKLEKERAKAYDWVVDLKKKYVLRAPFLYSFHFYSIQIVIRI